ncbi:hypothetical protein [Bacillus testis]|uniref:hypothetical protein n=1 Tax=Bacillus testis TaxID=1622072 RepID=UPI00067F6625|nr:hypothetical protein [Bacillus testis]
MNIDRSIVRAINIFIFIVAFTLHAYTDAVYESKKIDAGFLGSLKYVVIIMGIAFCILQIRKKKNGLLYLYEIKKIGTVIIVFLFISLLLSLFQGMFTSQTISELVKMLIPLFYVFCIMNTFEYKDIYYCMVTTLVVSIIGYILEIGIDTFSIANFTSISFSTSYSPFESHYAAGTSIALCAFFMYYRKSKILMLVSLLFAIITFKRLAIIFAIFLFIYSLFFETDKFVSKRYINFLKLVFIVGTIVYYFLLTPSFSNVFYNIFSVDATSLTMGRSYFLSNLLNSSYSSFGFGSSTVFMGRSLEMDLIKILLELSIVGLVFFVWNYYDLARKHLYGSIFMTFSFLNMLTSHSLTNSFYWILIMLILGCILYKREENALYLSNKTSEEKMD